MNRELKMIRRSGIDVEAIWLEGTQTIVASMPREWTDEQIRVYVNTGKRPGEVVKDIHPTPEEILRSKALEEEKLTQCDTPPEENGKKISKPEMLDALEKAGITGFKHAKYFALKTAYEKAVAEGKIKE